MSSSWNGIPSPIKKNDQVSIPLIYGNFAHSVLRGSVRPDVVQSRRDPVMRYEGDHLSLVSSTQNAKTLVLSLLSIETLVARDSLHSNMLLKLYVSCSGPLYPATVISTTRIAFTLSSSWMQIGSRSLGTRQVYHTLGVMSTACLVPRDGSDLVPVHAQVLKVPVAEGIELPHGRVVPDPRTVGLGDVPENVHRSSPVLWCWLQLPL